VERGGAGRRECGTFGCSRDVWFTRAQARAYAACGGRGRKHVNALGFWNAVARGRAGVERGGAGPRECGTRWRGAAREWYIWLQPERLVHPCSSTGLCRLRRKEGVNALGFWNAVARGDASVERGRAATRKWNVGCRRHAWFTRAQARAYAALGFWNAVARGDAEVERGGAGRRGSGTRWRGAAREWYIWL
jgi:hypothetical protein